MGQGGSKSGAGQGGDYSQYMDYSKYMSQGSDKVGKQDASDSDSKDKPSGTNIALISTDSSKGGSKSGDGQGGDYSQYMDYSKYMSQGGDSETDKGDGKGS